MKRVLAILSRPPYQGSLLLETLEAAMVTQAFDLPTTLLFRGEAVNALRSNQSTDQQTTRNLGKVVTALPTYEIDNILVCESSLHRFGLVISDLVIESEPVGEDRIRDLISEHDVVLGG